MTSFFARKIKRFFHDKNPRVQIQGLVGSFRNKVEEVFIDAASRKSGRHAFEIEFDLWDAVHLENSIIKDVILDMRGKKAHTMFQTMTVRDLTILMNNTFEWKKYLGGLVRGISEAKVTEDTVIGLMVPKSFLSDVAHKLTRYPVEVWANYFAWTLLKKLSPALPHVYFNAYHNIHSRKGKERWRSCLTDTEANMPLTVGTMFVERSITESKRNKTLQLVKEVRRAFERGVNDVRWLDEETRNAVKLKIESMIDVIAAPVAEVERRALEHRYTEVISSKHPSDLAAFLISCQKNLVRNNLRLLDVPAPRTEWNALASRLPLYAVNAFYDRFKNRMVVLAGIMKQPFLYENVPSYVDFGKLGTVVGHEMLHGFDNNGWYFDKDGNIAPWWTPKAAKEFNHHAKCLVNQYSRYPYGTISRFWGLYKETDYVNGSKTLSENIADNGGLKYAYKAYRSRVANNTVEDKPAGLNLNENQLFFLSYAQTWCRALSNDYKLYLLRSDRHSPAMYRVIGSITNLKEFGKVFNCPVGSKMNPYNRCEFW